LGDLDLLGVDEGVKPDLEAKDSISSEFGSGLIFFFFTLVGIFVADLRFLAGDEVSSSFFTTVWLRFLLESDGISSSFLITVRLRFLELDDSTETGSIFSFLTRGVVSVCAPPFACLGFDFGVDASLGDALASTSFRAMIEKDFER